MSKMKVLFLLFFVHMVASIPHRVSTNTIVLYDHSQNGTYTEESQTEGVVIYSVNAGFGPSTWVDGSLNFLPVISIEDCCSIDKLIELPSEFFVVITKRSGCSYEHKARNVQKLNASALILINREHEEGLLFPPLPELSYYTKPSSKHITIPTMIIKKGDGNTIEKKISEGGGYLSIYCAKTGNRALIHAWNFHWIFWLIVFTILFSASLVSLYLVSQGAPINRLIKPCILLTTTYAAGMFIILQLLIIANIMDMLTDHWNIRGIIPEPVSQVMYWLGLDPILYMYILTQWLWYRMLDEKDLLKYKAIVINRPIIYAILIGTASAGILKIILIAAGVTVMTSWRIYNSILVVMSSGIGIIILFSGYRLRKRLNQMMHKRSGTFKLVFLMVVGNVGMQFTSLSLLLWISVPSIFGVWSWFVFNFFWRFAAAFLGFLFLFVHGTKSSDRKEESGSKHDSKQNASINSYHTSTISYKSDVPLQTIV